MFHQDGHLCVNKAKANSLLLNLASDAIRFVAVLYIVIYYVIII